MIQKGRWFLDGMAVTTISLMLILLIASLFAPLIAPYDPTEIHMEETLQGISSRHLLGTDLLGRDLLSRILYGGRISVLLAIAATILSMFLGMLLGLIAGYWGGKIDTVITALTSIFQGLPGTSMMIAISAIMGPGIWSLLTALVINSWAGFSRIVRGKVLKLREETYIEGARSLGAGHLRIIVSYLLPNMVSDIIVLFATRIGGVVLSIAALSFLGLGIQPPTPDWGMMISEARTSFRMAPMLLIAPGACIIILSFGINYFGEVLRHYFDIKSQFRQKY